MPISRLLAGGRDWYYEVLDEYALGTTGRMVSKMRFKLETGRTHQIRAQAAHEGLPLIGDRTYHPLYRASKRVRGVVPIACERQALHAEELELAHPVSGQRLKWSAPLPADLQQLERALRGLEEPRPHLRGLLPKHRHALGSRFYEVRDARTIKTRLPLYR